MAIIYLVSDFAKLIKKGETLILSSPDSEHQKIFPFKTEQLYLFGNIDITGPALRLLMKYKINTVFLSKDGRYNGTLEFQSKKNVFLRKAQFELGQKDDFCLGFAKKIVEAKIKNQLSLVQRINRNRQKDKQIDNSIREIKSSLTRLNHANDLSSLRGYEGYCARQYFAVFGRGILNKDFTFTKRSSFPPKDPVNSVLSFLYTLILNRVDAALESLDLDPYFGFFHSLGYGKKSLVFDLMEEFRTPLADTLCLSLFNNRVLKKDDFESGKSLEEQDQTEDDLFDQNNLSLQEMGEEKSLIMNDSGIFLKKDALKKVITQFERKLSNEYFCPREAKRLSFKRLIFMQCSHFRDYLNGQCPEYEPLIIK